MSLARTRVLRQIFEAVAKEHGFDRVFRSVKIVSADRGNSKCTLHVDDTFTNRAGYLHGGMICSLVDSCSTLALMSATPKESSNIVLNQAEEDVPITSPGVSVDLHVSFLAPIPLGALIEIDSKLLRLGKRLANLHVEILNKDTGKIAAIGSHTKFVGS